MWGLIQNAVGFSLGDMNVCVFLSTFTYFLQSWVNKEIELVRWDAWYLIYTVCMDTFPSQAAVSSW